MTPYVNVAVSFDDGLVCRPVTGDLAMPLGAEGSNDAHAENALVHARTGPCSGHRAEPGPRSVGQGG